MKSETYVNKMMDSYKHMFGNFPRRNYTSPLDSSYHPEFDTSDFLEDEDILKYQ